jgi:hypothetical protein
MRDLPNIEKSARKGEYVGHCHGEWRIAKGDGWIAKCPKHQQEVRGRTLHELSEKLSQLDEQLSSKCA